MGTTTAVVTVQLLEFSNVLFHPYQMIEKHYVTKVDG